MLIDAIVERLGEEVDALNKRVEGAAEMTKMVEKGTLPQSPHHAFVLPLGLSPRGEGEAASGAFTQMLDEIVGVVLVVRAPGDNTGGKSLPKIHALVEAVLQALLGWGPEDAIGVLRLRRGQLLSVNAGVVIYQLEFAIQLQIRVLS